MSTFDNARFRPYHIRLTIVFTLQVLTSLAFDVAPLRAQNGTPPFDLWIVRDQTQLPSYVGPPNTLNMFGSWIDIQNNNPYLELKNNSTAAIEEFRMTIGNELYHFAPVGAATEIITVASKPSALQITPTSPQNGDELVLTFGGGGLLPGQFIHFQISFGLDSCPSCGLPSFQTVMFNMNRDGTSNGEKSQVTVKFAGLDPIGPAQWPDYPVSPFVDNHYAPSWLAMQFNPPTAYQFQEGASSIEGPTVLDLDLGLVLRGVGTQNLGPLPVTNPSESPLTWELVEFSGAGLGGGNAQFSVNSTTGTFSWNSTGAPLGQYHVEIRAFNEHGSDTGTLSFTLFVPEPASGLLVGMGLAGLALLSRRRRSDSACRSS